MAYCSNCGNLLEEGSNFCDQCGKAIRSHENTSYQSNNFSAPPQKAKLADAIVSMIFAIISMELSIFCFFPIFCIPFIGLCVAFICISRAKRTAYINLAVEENGFTKAANICSIVAIPLTAFFGFMGFIFTLTL